MLLEPRLGTPIPAAELRSQRPRHFTPRPSPISDPCRRVLQEARRGRRPIVYSLCKKMSFKISPKIKAQPIKNLKMSFKFLLGFRRRVRKTAVSSATLIEEFDSFLGEYFLVPVSIDEFLPRFLVSSCLAAVFEKIWSKMKMGFRVFVGSVHE